MSAKQDSADNLDAADKALHWVTKQFANSDLFFGHGTDNAADEAEYLIACLLTDGQRSQTDPAAIELTLAQRERIRQLTRQRIDERIPLAYLVGEAWFAGLPFTVDQRVIVPRSPFAELINRGFQPWLQSAPDKILDLCCGSGCIGIACAYAFEQANVDLVDLSADALDVANSNIARHSLQDRVTALSSDLFAALSGRRYDLIVSNPPYVDSQDLAAMPAEFHHEPAMALGSGADGLDLTRRILVQAADYLSDNGLLFVEVGNSGEALERLFPTVPFLWLEFEFGGHGVFVMTRDELIGYRPLFAAAVGAASNRV